MRLYIPKLNEECEMSNVEDLSAEIKDAFPGFLECVNDNLFELRSDLIEYEPNIALKSLPVILNKYISINISEDENPRLDAFLIFLDDSGKSLEFDEMTDLDKIALSRISADKEKTLTNLTGRQREVISRCIDLISQKIKDPWILDRIKIVSDLYAKASGWKG